jgi:hypothetical protein
MKRFAVLGACLLAVAAPSRADDPKDVKPITVPFELLKSRHMAVQVKINGKGPYRVVFDTGAPINLLNNRVAKESGVLPKDFKRPPFALFGSAGQFKIDTLEVGGVKAQNLPTAVVDQPTVTAMAKALGPIEGIVGFSFFARYRMTIDYQAREMTFVPTGFQPPDMMAKVMALLLAPPDKQKRVVAPAAQWGLRVTKGAGDDEAGVTVAEVLPGGPAAAAGLKAGDRLLTLDGRWTDTVADCFAAASHVRPGSAVPVHIRRDGQEKELTVTPQRGL